MAVSAKFIADFTQFDDAVQRSTVKLRSFQDGIGRVDKDLARFGNQFSGIKVVQEATLAARAIEQLGEEGGIAAGLTKLTANELQRVGATAKEAAAKLTAMGQDVPANIQKIVNAVSPLPQQLSLADRAAQLAKSSFGQMFGAFTAASLVTSAARGLVDLAKGAVASAGRTADLSDKLNISTAAIQHMDFVASQTGSTVEQFASSAFKLGVKLSGGSDSVEKAVQALGLSFDDLRRRKPEEQFETVVGALGRMDDATKRNELGVALFGKSFEQIAASVAQGYDKLAQEAGAASDAQIRALDRAGDAWDRFRSRAATNLRGLLGDAVLNLEALAQVLRDKGPAAIFSSIPDLLEDARRRRSTQEAGTASDERFAEFEKKRQTTAPVSEDFVKKLREAEQAVNDLTKAERAQIDAALKLGKSHEEISDAVGPSEQIIGVYVERLRAGERATKAYETAHYDAADAKKEFTKEAEKLTLQLIAAHAAGVPWNDIVKEYGGEAAKAAETSKRLGVSVADIVNETGKGEGLRIFNEAMKEIHNTAASLGNKLGKEFWQDQEDRAGKAGKALLDQIKRIDDARVKSARLATQTDIAQAEHAVAMAKARGDSAEKVYRLERELSRKKLEAAIRDAEEELRVRLATLDRTTTLGAIEYQAWVDAHKDAVDQMTADWIRGDELRRQSLESFGKSFKALMDDIPNTIARALEGGGGFKGAFESIGSQLGAMIGKSIGKSIGGEFGGVVGEAAGSLLVKGIVKGVTSKNAGIRIATGFALAGPLGALAAGIFGGRGPTKQELEGREFIQKFEADIAKLLTQQQKLEAGGIRWKETTILVRDAYLATGRSAEQAEKDVKSLWDTSKKGAEAARLAAEEINAVLMEQQADVERLNAAIEKYGFTIEELGPAMRAQQLNDQAKELIEDWRVLVGSGIDLALVNERMSDAMSDYLNMAIRTGTEVPAAMKPILESLAAQGQLRRDLSEDEKKALDASKSRIDEIGRLLSESQSDETTQRLNDELAKQRDRVAELTKPYKDLEEAGVTFAETMTQGFDRVVLKLQELIDKLQGTGKAISDIPAINIPVNVADIDAAINSRLGNGRGGFFGGRGDVIPMAGGGSGTVSKPTLFMAGESGPESYAFSGANKSFKPTDVSGVEERLDSLERLFRDMPRAIRIAMQDAIALA